MTDATKAGLLCPVCRVDLDMTDRQGVEIDYCPKCRGVWLDRGELDKIIERSIAYQAAPETGRSGYPRRDDRYEGDGDRQHDGKRRRRKSFLDEIFDF